MSGRLTRLFMRHGKRSHRATCVISFSSNMTTTMTRRCWHTIILLDERTVSEYRATANVSVYDMVLDATS